MSDSVAPVHLARPSYRVERRRHPLRWLSAVLVVGALALLVRAFAQGQIEWSVVGQFLTAKVILRGFINTVLISALAMLLGLVLGTAFAVMRLSPNPVTSTVAWLYVWLFRGTPVILQLLIWFNIALVFPTITIPGLYHGNTIHVVTPFIAALLGLGINEGAYLTEVVRAGIISVDSGQTEAATALGMSRSQTLRRIVLPQAMRLIIPPVGNEAIGMLKVSSLAAIISYTELLNSAQQVYFVNGAVIELLFVCAIWYIAATTVLSALQYVVERRFGRGLSSQSSGAKMKDRIAGLMNRLPSQREAQNA